MDKPASELSNSSAPDVPPVVMECVPFEQELARHTAAVRLYVRSLMPGYEGADDLAQEVLLKVWEKREEYVAGTYFKAWAFQIARYLVMNQRRKIARSNVIAMDDELMDKIDQHWLQSDCAESDQELEAMEQCMEGLTLQDKQLLHARYATDVSLETYAEREGTRPGTLKARLFRLRESLRRCIESRLSDE